VISHLPVALSNNLNMPKILSEGSKQRHVSGPASSNWLALQEVSNSDLLEIVPIALLLDDDSNFRTNQNLNVTVSCMKGT
jgi:hypothetical protein